MFRVVLALSGSRGSRSRSKRPNGVTCAVKVLREAGRSYRFIAKELNLSPNTIMGIAHRH